MCEEKKSAGTKQIIGDHEGQGKVAYETESFNQKNEPLGSDINLGKSFREGDDALSELVDKNHKVMSSREAPCNYTYSCLAPVPQIAGHRKIRFNTSEVIEKLKRKQQKLVLGVQEPALSS